MLIGPPWILRRPRDEKFEEIFAARLYKKDIDAGWYRFSYMQYLCFGQAELAIFGVIRATSRGRIVHVSELVSSLWMQRLSSLVGTAESSTALPWKSLDKRVGAEGVSQTHVKTS